MANVKPKAVLRQHVLSPAHNLDRVKLSLQRGPLGGLDREDGERIALLWNLSRHMSDEEIQLLFDQNKCP